VGFIDHAQTDRAERGQHVPDEPLGRSRSGEVLKTSISTVARRASTAVQSSTLDELIVTPAS